MTKEYAILVEQIENAETVMSQLEKMPSTVRLISYEISGMITLTFALGIIDQEKREEMEKDNDSYLNKLIF